MAVTQASPMAHADASANRLSALDGWRGASILLVLATHLLPLRILGHLGYITGTSGMAIFFCLSGFLITQFLMGDKGLRSFFIRRLTRVVPLAWLYMLVVWAIYQPSTESLLQNLFFVANIPTQQFMPSSAHMWSLCQEVQFYVMAGLLYWLLGRRFIYPVAMLTVGVIALRIQDQIYASSITYYRLDEILVGCLLAAAWLGPKRAQVEAWLARLPLSGLLVLFIASCALQTTWFNYARAPLCALLVGATLAQPGSLLVRYLTCRPLVYIAGISYALYVIHPLLADSWLGEGNLVEKYAKRPLLVIILFGLAHLSTRYYEKWWMDWGRRLERRLA